MSYQHMASRAVRSGIALTGPGGYLRIGMSVRVPAWSDWFMRGETHATIVKIGRKYAHVKGVRSGKAWRVALYLFEDDNGYDATGPLRPGMGD